MILEIGGTAFLIWIALKKSPFSQEVKRGFEYLEKEGVIPL